MIIIIAGGRNHRLTHWEYNLLETEILPIITRCVVGCSKGVDTDAEAWARVNRIPVDPFPAEWDNISHPDAIVRYRHDNSVYDAGAGFRRNELMAVHAANYHSPGGCVLFPGGSGTYDMYKRARRHNLKIWNWR